MAKKLEGGAFRGEKSLIFYYLAIQKALIQVGIVRFYLIAPPYLGSGKKVEI